MLQILQVPVLDVITAFVALFSPDTFAFWHCVISREKISNEKSSRALKSVCGRKHNRLQVITCMDYQFDMHPPPPFFFLSHYKTTCMDKGNKCEGFNFAGLDFVV